MTIALPSTFALKSSTNNKYLTYVPEDEMIGGLLKFSAADATSKSLTKFEIELASSDDGLVHIKSTYNNKYWRKWSPEHKWIAADADQPEEDKSKWSCTLFEPVFADGTTPTLQFRHVQLGGLVASSLQADEPFKYCLFVSGNTTPAPEKLDTFTFLNLGPVSRDISDVNFVLKDAKVKDKTTVELATGIAVNQDEHLSEAKVVTLEYTKTGSCTWKATSSGNSNVLTNIKSSIPVILNDIIQLSGNELGGGPYEWGTAFESSYRVKTTYKVIVPPKTMFIVTLKATQAIFEAPFSYTLHDTFADGKDETTKKDDGIFTGVNLYNFKFDLAERRRV